MLHSSSVGSTTLVKNVLARGQNTVSLAKNEIQKAVYTPSAMDFSPVFGKTGSASGGYNCCGNTGKAKKSWTA